MANLPKKRYILRTDFSLTEGPKGDKGDTGTAGAGGSLPINTSDVIHNGTSRTGENLRDLLDELLYEPVSILTFNPTNNQTVYEQGTSLTSIPVEWSLNKDITGGSQVITGATLSPTALLDSDRATTLISSGMVSDTIVTLTVDDNAGYGSEQKTINFKFYWPVFYGQGEDPGTITSTWLRNTLNKSLQATKSAEFSTTAVVDQYAWIAVPISYGVPSFTVNGFSANFVQVHGSGNPFSHTTTQGGTADYYVYRSENTEQAQDIVVT